MNILTEQIKEAKTKLANQRQKEAQKAQAIGLDYLDAKDRAEAATAEMERLAGLVGEQKRKVEMLGAQLEIVEQWEAIASKTIG